MKQSLCVGICSNKDNTFRDIIRQEKVFFNESNDVKKLTQCACIVLDKQCNKKEKAILKKYLNDGGAILTSHDIFSALFPIKFKKEKSKTIKILDPLHGNQIDLDLFSQAYSVDNKIDLICKFVGEGVLVSLPFNVSLIINNHETCFKKPDNCFFGPIEEISLIDKNAVKTLVVNCLRFTFLKRNLPYVHLGYFPNGYENIFIFRIDHDDYRTKDFRNALGQLRNYNLQASWFLSCKEPYKKKVIYDLKKANQDIQSHHYQHKVYGDYKKDFENVLIAKNILKKFHISPVGIVAPEGKWTNNLQRVYEKSGYKYSSEFSLSYDGYPFFIKNQLQIPIHPYCFGDLLNSNEKFISEYYERVINNKINNEEPIILYEHVFGSLGKYPSILEGIMKKINSFGSKIKKFTMTEFYEWWVMRDDEHFEAIYDKENRNIIFSGKIKSKEVTYRIILPNKEFINFSGDEISLKNNTPLGKILPYKGIKKTVFLKEPDFILKNNPYHMDNLGWKRYSKYFFKNLKEHMMIHRFLQKELIGSSKENSKTLEVASGTAIDSCYLSYNNREAFAVDLSDSALELSKNISSFFDTPVSFKKANALELPFKDDEFDLVFSCGLIHFFKDPMKFIIEQKRVLKKGGILIIDVPNKFSPAVIPKHILMALNKHPWGWETEYTKNSLKKIASKAGLKILKTYNGSIDRISLKIANITKTKYGVWLPLFIKEMIEKQTEKVIKTFDKNFPQDIGIVAIKE